MSVLSELNPASIWIHFEEICKIPRLSKNEGKIRKYLLDFASGHNLESKEDTAGNILIIRPASQGFEGIRTIVLQSHMDMVGEKNSDYLHNWLTDPIVPYIEDGWVTAGVTTLGADDGIGMAAQLALLSDSSLKAGKIECLFTVDEETGLTGAFNLKADFFDGRILINLDSEEEGILYIGCAGGMDTVGELTFQSVAVPEGMAGFEISLTGLHGGHSGDEIHKGFGNSVKLMNRILQNLSLKFGILLNRFNGGNLRNAIPREAFAVIAADSSDKKSIIESVMSFQSLFNEEFGEIEKDLKISINEIEPPSLVIDKKTRDSLIKALACCPHGVIAWSKEMDDLVETSTNLASVNFIEESKIRIVTTQRSSVELSKYQAAAMVESCLKPAGATIEHSDGYPGWKPSLKSEILQITRKSYINLFGREPAVRAIHAGLECGLFYEKFKEIDMISIGPSIKGAHTPDEKIEIKTVSMFWNLLLDVIRNIAPDKSQGDIEST
jgi:dipeptidase D